MDRSDRCPTCDRLLATREAWGHIRSCQEEDCHEYRDMCFSDAGLRCIHPPVDWRARYIESETRWEDTMALVGESHEPVTRLCAACGGQMAPSREGYAEHAMWVDCLDSLRQQRAALLGRVRGFACAFDEIQRALGLRDGIPGDDMPSQVSYVVMLIREWRERYGEGTDDLLLKGYGGSTAYREAQSTLDFANVPKGDPEVHGSYGVAYRVNLLVQEVNRLKADAATMLLTLHEMDMANGRLCSLLPGGERTVIAPRFGEDDPV